MANKIIIGLLGLSLFVQPALAGRGLIESTTPVERVGNPSEPTALRCPDPRYRCGGSEYCCAL